MNAASHPWQGADSACKLWQVQLAGDTAAFAFMILSVAKEALLEHPDPRVRTLQAVETFLHVRLIVATPSHAGPSDKDRVGLVEWQLAIYSNGLHGALAFIELILNYKVQKGILAGVPELLAHVVDPGGAPLPASWKNLQDLSIALPKLFSAMPPRGRRHVLAQLERQSGPASSNQENFSNEPEKNPEGQTEEEEQGPAYMLIFYGNLYPFKDRFEAHGIPGTLTTINDPEGPDYVRYVKCKYEAVSMEIVILVLREILKDMPVYFINMAGENDVMAAWLRQEKSIIPAESHAPAAS
jgi:hypothetical protein